MNMTTKDDVTDLDEHPTVVGLAEIARRLGAPRATVDMWRYRGLFPAPRWQVGGRPAWRWQDVERWAKATGRGGES